jgi:hypothetical protein
VNSLTTTVSALRNLSTVKEIIDSFSSLPSKIGFGVGRYVIVLSLFLK